MFFAAILDLLLLYDPKSYLLEPKFLFEPPSSFDVLMFLMHKLSCTLQIAAVNRQLTLKTLGSPFNEFYPSSTPQKYE